MTDLQLAAQAVLDRWDSPQWKWDQQGSTADLMHVLRAAIAQPAKTFIQERAQLEQEWCDLQRLKAAYKLPQPVQPAVEQWQKKRLTQTDNEWVNTNEPDAKWCLEQASGYEIRVLYAGPTPQPVRPAPVVQATSQGDK